MEVNGEPIGQMFGLFGATDEPSDDEGVATQTEEGEICETDDIVTKNECPIDPNKCCICQSTQIKYRCPKCQSKTCSLFCCKRHKSKYDCDGIRDKLSFVKISDFTQSEFLSDYFFLEDVDRALDNSSREKRSIVNSKPILPKWLLKLQREARLRGTTLKIMPASFQRRKQNTTCFMYAEKTINWDIELKFVNAIHPKLVTDWEQFSDEDSINWSEVSSVKRRICENTKLQTIISEYIETDDKSENTEVNRKLFLYHKTGLEGIAVLFKDESRPQKRYFELDLNKSIKDNLKNKTVVEFPTLLVVLNKFKHLFDSMSDEGSEKTVK